MVMNILVRMFLNILSLPCFSRTYGWFTRRRRPRFLVREIINLFKTAYHIDMDQFQGEETDYASLSDFFVRPLDPQNRPLLPVADAVVSPADGTLQHVETVYEDRATQVKGKYYKVSELIRESIDLARGWHLATVYLSPADYHRFHYPVTGTLAAYCHTRGRIYPVNSLGLNLVDRLFVRNERVICRFQVKGLPFYMIAVGATFVGSIRMEFVEKIRRRSRWKIFDRGIEVEQLAEMGRFAMGSTIILLFPKELARPVSDRKDNRVRVGDPLFSFGGV
jgi:phosphatidylserine decarboxylase